MLRSRDPSKVPAKGTLAEIDELKRPRKLWGVFLFMRVCKNFFFLPSLYSRNNVRGFRMISLKIFDLIKVSLKLYKKMRLKFFSSQQNPNVRKGKENESKHPVQKMHSGHPDSYALLEYAHPFDCPMVGFFSRFVRCRERN